MKLTIQSALCLLTFSATLLSCVKDDKILPDNGDGKSLSLNYSVDGSSVQPLSTRAVPGTIAENKVNNVMVLFFEPTADGSGKFIGYAASVTSDDPASASGTSRVSMPPGNEVESAYSLIILSNYTTYLRIGSSANLDEFLTNTLTNKTQKEARFLIKGVADSPSGIKAVDGLPMCCEYNKAAGTNLIYINFKRIVARVDLLNSATPSNFVLKSAQIWNVRKSCAVGSNGYGADGDYTHYRDRVVTTDNDRIEGSLYAFENNTLVSSPNDALTTCLIVGGYYNGNSTLSYYRINVVAQGNNQTMGRNHLYTINIKSVAGAGADNPDDAYSKDKSIVKYDINDWDDSFNGMYFFDADGNGLAVSLRNVTFANTGGQLDIEVYRIDSPDPTKRITEPWSVAMKEGMQGQSFLVNRITDTERFRIAAPNENATTNNREGVAEVKWGRIIAPINVTQLNYLSQTHGIKIVPTYLRYPSAGGVKEMTVSLEGNFAGITADDVAPVIIYSEVGQSWLSTAYNASKSNTTKGVFVYDVTCETLPDGKDYRTADLKVTITQQGKTITGSVNTAQAKSYSEDDPGGAVRQLNTTMLEYENGKYINSGSLAKRYAKFEGMPADKKGERDLHFNIIEHQMRRYEITLQSSSDWRLITPDGTVRLHYKVTERNVSANTTTVLSDYDGSTGNFYKGNLDSFFFVEISTTSNAISGWSGSFYIEFDDGEQQVFNAYQTGLVAAIGADTKDWKGNPIAPETLFYYETFTMNGVVWLDRDLGAKSKGFYTHLTTDYPDLDEDANGVSMATETNCPPGCRMGGYASGTGREWDYIFGKGDGISGMIKYTGDSNADPLVPYKNIWYVETGDKTQPVWMFSTTEPGTSSLFSSMLWVYRTQWYNAYMSRYYSNIAGYTKDYKPRVTADMNYTTINEGLRFRCVRK